MKANSWLGIFNRSMKGSDYEAVSNRRVPLLPAVHGLPARFASHKERVPLLACPAVHGHVSPELQTKPISLSGVTVGNAGSGSIQVSI